MNDTLRPYVRRQYFVKKKFQADFILKFSLIVLAGIVISTALLFFFSQDTLTSSYVNSRLEIQSTGRAILPALVMTNLVTLGLICVCSIVVMVFVSHKLAGPMLRFEKDIKRVAGGDLTLRINLRKNDQLKDMSFELNRMIHAFHDKVTYIDTTLADIQAKQASGETIEEDLEQLRNRISDSFRINR